MSPIEIRIAFGVIVALVMVLIPLAQTAARISR